MNHVVDVAEDGARVPLSRRRVAEIARAVLRAEAIPEARLSITFVSSHRIAALNRRHLRHRGSTDVISFPFAPGSPGDAAQGDIYIAPDVAKRNAREHNVSWREELTRLVVHGVLHVLGFDHPAGESRRQSAMWRLQERLVASVIRQSATPDGRNSRKARLRKSATARRRGTRRRSAA